jgi:hypothetical protein
LLTGPSEFRGHRLQQRRRQERHVARDNKGAVNFAIENRDTGCNRRAHPALPIGVIDVPHRQTFQRLLADPLLVTRDDDEIFQVRPHQYTCDVPHERLAADVRQELALGTKPLRGAGGQQDRAHICHLRHRDGP